MHFFDIPIFITTSTAKIQIDIDKVYCEARTNVILHIILTMKKYSNEE